jgi:hypothetical protein
MFTCDCGRTALFESTTFPPKLAVVYCADAGDETHRTKTPATIEHIGDRIVFLLSPSVPGSQGLDYMVDGSILYESGGPKG